MKLRLPPWLERYLIVVAGLILYVVIQGIYGLGLVSVYWQRVVDQGLFMAVGSLGLSLIYGFTGQFSLGHAGFYAVGAYTAGYIGRTMGHGDLGWFVVALLAGTLLTGALAFLVGLPILRLRSDYLGIATLGFGIIVKVLLDNADRVIPALGGARGMLGTPQVANFTWIYWSLILVLFVFRNLVCSSFGRSCLAIREDEVAADAMGVNTTYYKTVAFVLGCAVAGLAGALYAHRYPYLHPSSFDFLKAFDFLLIVVVGGLGSLSGTVATAIGWVFLLEGLRSILGEAFLDFRGVIYALLLIVVILLRPQGLFSGRELGILVPRSLQSGILGSRLPVRPEGGVKDAGAAD
ncbi:MAG TPA: branched-chain amino acid ABC transporter permease [Firmicutes bacterium]|nr:branched-chain amino acid ABC transporter permease [Bacillota bacterium]